MLTLLRLAFAKACRGLLGWKFQISLWRQLKQKINLYSVNTSRETKFSKPRGNVLMSCTEMIIVLMLLMSAYGYLEYSERSNELIVNELSAAPLRAGFLLHQMWTELLLLLLLIRVLPCLAACQIPANSCQIWWWWLVVQWAAVTGLLFQGRHPISLWRVGFSPHRSMDLASPFGAIDYRSD